MKVAVYSTKDFEHEKLIQASERSGFAFQYFQEPLNLATAPLCDGCEAVLIFAGDDASGDVLRKLAAQGVRYIGIRAAGYDNVDLEAAHRLDMRVANVPAYSPYAIAEHAVAMILALNRKLILADRQVHNYNFTVGNLVGFDLHGKTVGIIGTGKIGAVTAHILKGFGCHLLGYDISPNGELEKLPGFHYCDLPTLCSQSDIITIHTCLNNVTRYLIQEELINQMRPGVILVNTARGAVVKTEDVIRGLHSNKIGGYGADVYEHERGVFFYDRSLARPDDALLKELLSLPNVLITPHQAFATQEALNSIADSTCFNISCWAKGEKSPNEL